MKCPRCDRNDDRVLDSRKIKGGAEVRRRRHCNRCGTRFTTYEVVDYDHSIGPPKVGRPKNPIRMGEIGE